jgi:NAD(P)H-nitrite reductase large subunit
VTELFGLTCASVGQFREGPGTEPIIFHDPVANIYRKILVDHKGQVAGVVLVGRAQDAQELGILQAMIRRGTDISRWKEHLARERTTLGHLGLEALKAQLARRQA